MGRHLSPRNGQVILVSGYAVLSIDDNIDVQSAFSWAFKVARKCESKHWFACGVDSRSLSRSVTCLPNFLGWVDLLTHGAPQARFV